MPRAAVVAAETVVAETVVVATVVVAAIGVMAAAVETAVATGAIERVPLRNSKRAAKLSQRVFYCRARQIRELT